MSNSSWRKKIIWESQRQKNGGKYYKMIQWNRTLKKSNMVGWKQEWHIRKSSSLHSPEDKSSGFRTMDSDIFYKEVLTNRQVSWGLELRRPSSPRVFAVHPLKTWSLIIYTKYTWTRAVWFPDGQATSKGALPVRSNYRLALAWPAKQLALLLSLIKAPIRWLFKVVQRAPLQSAEEAEEVISSICQAGRYLITASFPTWCKKQQIRRGLNWQ